MLDQNEPDDGPQRLPDQIEHAELDGDLLAIDLHGLAGEVATILELIPQGEMAAEDARPARAGLARARWATIRRGGESNTGDDVVTLLADGGDTGLASVEAIGHQKNLLRERGP